MIRSLRKEHRPARRATAFARWLLTLGTLAALACAACGGDAGDAPHAPGPCPSTVDPDVALALGSFCVAVTAGTSSWEVYYEGDSEALLRSPLEGPTLRSAMGQPGHRAAFGQFQIFFEGQRGMQWSTVGPSAATLHREEGAIELRLAHDDGDSSALRFELSPEGDLSLRLIPAGDTGELRFACNEDEAFFGLGTQVTGLDLRNRRFPLWTQEQGIGKPERGGVPPLNNIPEAAYAPMGVLYSSRGYAMLVEHDSPFEVDVCSDGVLAWRSFPRPPALRLIAAPSPREIVARVTHYTGRLGPTPDWVFGPWNNAVGGPEVVERLAGLLRRERIPSSAMWTEDWIGGSLTANGFRLSYRWEWDPDTYPNLPDMVANLQGRGFAFLAYFNPFVPMTVPHYAEGEDRGFLLRRDDGSVYTFQDPAFRTASMVDLSNEEARLWVRGYLERALRDLDLDGWMADFAEWYPLDASPASGEHPWEVHNRYPLLWQQTHREAFERVYGSADSDRAPHDWTFFARSGWASARGGSGGLAPVLWPGDQNTDFGYDDGLPSILPIALHAGLSGAALFGSDIAGYSTFLRTPNTTKELFARWTTVGALSPVMRTHHGSDKCNNWRLESDAESLEHWRRWASIHTLLLPFWRGLAAEAQSQGWPVMRHPWLVEPDIADYWTARDYHYFLGDDLLIAPVLDAGSTERDVLLPSPGWWPLFGQAPLASPSPSPHRVTWPTPVTEVPVFVRPGTVLPLLGRVVDSFYGVTGQELSDLRAVERWQRMILYPDPSGNVRSRESAEVRVHGALSDHRAWPSEGIQVNGVTVPTCPAGVDRDAPTCLMPDALLLQLRGSTTFVVRGQGIALDVEVAEGLPWHIDLAIGGGGWQEWTLPAPFSPTPDAATFRPSCPASTAGDPTEP